MNKIIQSHLKRFTNLHGYSKYSESEQFEFFVNYCIAASLSPGRFETQDITTGSDDSGIDGIIIIIDDEIVTSKDEADALFNRERRSREVTIAFIQAKSGESFNKSDILSFGSAVDNFISDAPQIPLGETEIALREILNTITSDNLHKVRGGKPNCELFLVTTGAWKESDPILNGAANKISQDIEKSSMFSSVRFSPLGRDQLLRRWIETYEPVAATFQVKGYTPFPAMNGVIQSYVAVVPATSFINAVLDSGNGRIRASVFQENVRSFLGDENVVNAKIAQTINSADTRARFAVLNNGVTIVAREVRVQGDQVHIRNFQIVNGCQTSHVLFQLRANVDDSVMIPMKIIQSEDATVITQIVEATNRQTQIEQTQFLSLKSKVREIEEYFNSFDDDDTGRRLYLERRERQYAGQDIPNARIVDIETLARSYAAMFLDLPHLSARYPRRLLEQQKESIFQDSHIADAYYAAAFTNYRLQSLFSNKVIPGSCFKYRWHILTSIKYLVAGQKTPNPDDRKLKEVSSKIVDAVRNANSANPGPFGTCVEIFKKLGDPTRDRVKGQAFVHELKTALKKHRSS